jgi:phage protein D
MRQQQRLLLGLRRLREQRAAMAVGRGDVPSGYVVAEQQDARRMAAVGEKGGSSHLNHIASPASPAAAAAAELDRARSSRPQETTGVVNAALKII